MDKSLLLAFFLLFLAIAGADRSFTTSNGTFVKDGKKHQIVSGSLHYWRVRPEGWADRMTKMKAAGLNALMTYIPWNLHNPQPNLYNFAGDLDVVKFTRMAAKIGLDVILRPSPYICAEFEFGGHPYWLFNNASLEFRANNPAYLGYWNTFMNELAPLLVPLQYSYGGPVIMIQIENEYGSWGSDVSYTTALKDSFTQRGIDRTLFFQSNGAAIYGGNIAGVLHTLNGPASSASLPDSINNLLAEQPGQPILVSEFWDGWFDTWGNKKHSTTNALAEAKNVDWILANGHSINFYMFNGGTNFGFTNGAESDGSAITTSYDYDCALDERGNLTLKYQLFSAAIKKNVKTDHVKLPAVTPVANYGDLTFTESFSFDFTNEKMLSKIGSRDSDSSSGPINFEATGQDFGFKLYRTNIPASKGSNPAFRIETVRDLALVWRDSDYVGKLERKGRKELYFNSAASGSKVYLFVENQGRINFGLPMKVDRKGIFAPIEFENTVLTKFSSWSFPLPSVSNIPFSKISRNATTPTFYRGNLVVRTKPADTWISLPGWTKGNVWINNYNIGRFNVAGPQRNLYVPNSLLKQGNNQIVVFELFQSASNHTVSFVNHPDLGPL